MLCEAWKCEPNFMVTDSNVGEISLRTSKWWCWMNSQEITKCCHYGDKSLETYPIDLQIFNYRLG